MCGDSPIAFLVTERGMCNEHDGSSNFGVGDFCRAYIP